LQKNIPGGGGGGEPASLLNADGKRGGKKSQIKKKRGKGDRRSSGESTNKKTTGTCTPPGKTQGSKAGGAGWRIFWKVSGKREGQLGQGGVKRRKIH